MLHHANGECGSCHLIDGDWFQDAHDREPLCLVDNTKVTMGMTKEQHSCDTRWSDWRERDCDCEVMAFSWSSCEGCGSTLGGERHAMTLWLD